MLIKRNIYWIISGNITIYYISFNIYDAVKLFISQKIKYLRNNPFSYFPYLEMLPSFCYIFFWYLLNGYWWHEKRNNLFLSLSLPLSHSKTFNRERQSISSHVVVNWWLLAHEVLINFLHRVDNWAFPFWFRLLA